ncbi:MAG: DUF3097 family protein, partial [Yonghaparkia sp.]|nr:DUF3097 family protein [Microcella sp.]
MRDYGDDVLSGDWRAVGRSVVPERHAETGLVVELPDDGGPSAGWVGAVVLVDAGTVHLEDRHGRVRAFPLGAGFLVDGEPVRLVAPVRSASASAGRARTA